jgi:drug/metabolite transporter (DMT)-like permease
MLSGIGALRYGAVADAMVIYATVPFVTAGIAYLFIGEIPSRSTIIASFVAVTGVLVMLAGATFGGGSLGQGLAVIMSLSMASFTVVMRQHREVAMLPAMAASAYLCSFVCFWFAEPLTISHRDFLLVMLFGVVQNATGLALYVFGSRRVPAAEATLLAALEVPLTPFWVWLALGETPTSATLAGGSIVLAALIGHILIEMRRGAPAETIAPAQP